MSQIVKYTATGGSNEGKSGDFWGRQEREELFQYSDPKKKTKAKSKSPVIPKASHKCPQPLKFKLRAKIKLSMENFSPKRKERLKSRNTRLQKPRQKKKEEKSLQEKNH